MLKVSSSKPFFGFPSPGPIPSGECRLALYGAMLQAALENYFGDLSNYSQHKFTSHHLFSYAELPDNSKDIDIINQFLKLNFCGIPQSKEHIEFVKSINSLEYLLAGGNTPLFQGTEKEYMQYSFIKKM